MSLMHEAQEHHITLQHLSRHLVSFFGILHARPTSLRHCPLRVCLYILVSLHTYIFLLTEMQTPHFLTFEIKVSQLLDQCRSRGRIITWVHKKFTCRSCYRCCKSSAAPVSYGAECNACGLASGRRKAMSSGKG